MANNRIYVALGEEPVRGTKQSASVGFVPVLNPSIPKAQFTDTLRKEFRGDDAVKGDTAVIRNGQKWSGTLDVPFFTEAGSVKGMMGTLLKHFFGKATSTQNGATGQYGHMMYPVADPFDAANLDTKALTLNLNINQGTAMKNWPYVGGRVRSLTFDQQAGSSLKLTAELMGQYRDTVTAEIGSPVYAAENLRCDYNELKVYTGPVTRIGTAPDYTGFTFAGATQIKPDKISLKLENSMEDVVRLSGANYPDKTRLGQYKATFELTIDWEDPASGFSSVSEFNSWMASAGSTNFCLSWDTGTQAGTGDNHGMFIDLPVIQRMGSEPSYAINKDPMVTLRYQALYDATNAKYLAAVLLKNTASAV